MHRGLPYFHKKLNTLNSAYGCLQYLLHAQQVWRTLHPLPASNAEDITQLQKMLAWDVVYFVASFALVVICAGAILRQAWARVSLQVADVAYREAMAVVVPRLEAALGRPLPRVGGRA